MVALLFLVIILFVIVAAISSKSTKKSVQNPQTDQQQMQAEPPKKDTEPQKIEMLHSKKSFEIEDFPIEIDSEKLRYIYNDVQIDTRKCTKNYLPQIYAGSVLDAVQNDKEIELFFHASDDQRYYLGSIFEGQQFYRMICDFINASRSVVVWIYKINKEKTVATIGLAFYQTCQSFDFYEIIRLSGHSREMEENAWMTYNGEILSGEYDEEHERYEIWSSRSGDQIGFLKKSISNKVLNFVKEGYDVKIVSLRKELEDISDMTERKRVNMDILIMIS